MKKENEPRAESTYTRYPVSSIATYNGVTVLHFLLGGLGIILGYGGLTGYFLGGLYYVFSFVQMYVVMPVTVCPTCVYYRLEKGLCVSGLNVISKKIAKKGDAKDFPARSQGLFCHNNVYMAALFIPIVAMIPALVLNFSFVLLAIFVPVVGLLLFRFFVIFGKIACVHCNAKYMCPNAEAMGIDK